MPHGPHQPSDRGRSPLTGARPAQETQSTAHPFRAPTPTSDSRFRRSSISPNALGFLEQKRRKSTRTQRVARTNARPPAHGYKCRSTPPLLTSSLPRAVSDYRYTPPPNDDCFITLRSWVSRSTCRVRLPSIEQDEDHAARVGGDGASGGGDPAPAPLELGPGPGGAAVPHAERLLLPSRGRGGEEPGGRGRELLRRRADAARAGGGAGALLPDGGAAGARRGRARGDRLQRGGRAVPGGRRARRRRRRLRRLRANHGAQAPHPHRRVHRRHLLLPAPRRPGDPLQVRWRGVRRGHAAPRRRRLLRPALHQLVGGPLPGRPNRRHALHRPQPPPRARPTEPGLPARRVSARAGHAVLRAAAGGPYGQAGDAAHRRGYLQALPGRPGPPPLAAATARGRAAVQHVRGAGGARVAVRVPGTRPARGPAHQAVLRHGRAAAAAAAAPRGVLRQRDLHGHAAGGRRHGDGRGGGGRGRDPGGAGPDGRRVLPVRAGVPGAAAGPVGAGARRAHVPVPQPGSHQLGAPAHPRRRLRVGPARVHGPRRHRVRGPRVRAAQRQPRRQPLRGHLAAGRAHGEVPEAHLRLLIPVPPSTERCKQVGQRVTVQGDLTAYYCRLQPGFFELIRTSELLQIFSSCLPLWAGCIRFVPRVWSRTIV